VGQPRQDPSALDLAALVRQWSAHARASEAGALEPLAPKIVGTRYHVAPAEPLEGRGPAEAHTAPLTDAQANRLIQEAAAALQAAQSTWTEADLIRYLGERLPAQVGAMTAAQAAALLPSLARQALATEAVMLAAPEWPRVPDTLRRASGESVYTPHGAARYATSVQLTLEDRFLAHAQEQGAPRLNPVTAARFLGAQQAQLEAQLQAPATTEGAITTHTGSGLRLDQAAAGYHALTSTRRAEVLAGPAGSGKTRTLAEVARLWRQAGQGEVIGLTTSQTARNVLADAGVTHAYNTARFLGHLYNQREALGALPVEHGSLLILDEASMMSLADMAAILALAHANDCKVVVTGDHEQLTAVEGGGGMTLLARRHGYVQLAEPQRFTHAWERNATLRLRAGDVTVLAVYEEHGRLRGGTPEEATEQAYRGWLADYLDGKDTILMARTEEQVRELSRRARDDLIRYGLVAGGPGIRLTQGEHASTGDLIMARRNTRTIQVGEDGRDLANRDVLQITRTNVGPRGRHTEVRRLTGRDPTTGHPQWSAPFQIPARYLAAHATLAYATTQHAALGRTTSTAHVLVDGLGDRQGLYVAMSRGRDANHAYCITLPRTTDTRPGSRAAPELDRTNRLTREHAAVPATRPAADEQAPVLHPVSVLAGVLARDGSELSATETLQRELSNADHLGILGGIWDDITRRAQAARYEQALRDALPAGLAQQALDDPACTWLWRTLRESEAAGLDGGQVLQQAVASRSMAGARDVARVLDSRVRHMLDGIQPDPPGPWADHVPCTGSADLDHYLRELAEAMDDRTRRLGEHTAADQPTWTHESLGPVPGDPVARLDWERRASLVAAYRERYGYAHPEDPIGPEPSEANPEARAAWHAALAALGRVDGIDLRGCTDGDLWLRRSTYERETAWAPPRVTEELRLIRTAERDAHVNAVRADHESHTAKDQQAAKRHRQLATIWRALEAKAAEEADIFTAVQDTRCRWEAITETTRRISIAADLELRRRHPDTTIEPLRPHPAEADGITYPANPDSVHDTNTGERPTLNGSETPDSTNTHRPEQEQATASRPRDIDRQAALGLIPEAAHGEIPDQVLRIRENARIAQAKLDDLANLPLPAAEDDSSAPCLAWPVATRPDRDAVLQPPRPDVVPSARILAYHQANAHRSADAEMG
jgi:hypothetical protein